MISETFAFFTQFIFKFITLLNFIYFLRKKLQFQSKMDYQQFHELFFYELLNNNNNEDDDDDFFEENPLTQEEISQIPEVDEVPSGEVCSICLTEFDESNAAALQLPCNHNFHKDCIIPWFKTSSTCPMCRHQLGEGRQILLPVQEQDEENQNEDDDGFDDEEDEEFDSFEIFMTLLNNNPQLNMSIEELREPDNMSVDEMEAARLVTVLPPGT